MIMRRLLVVGAVVLLIVAVGIVKAAFWPAQQPGLVHQGPEQQLPPGDKPSLFDGLSGMLDSVDESQMTDEQRRAFRAQKADLHDMYRDADNAWQNTKADMRAAIRDLNRQIRVRNRQPNVILITAAGVGLADVNLTRRELLVRANPANPVIDDSRAVSTPYLDALARTGVRFSNYHVGATSSIPAQAAMETGLHPGHMLIRGTDPVTALPSGEVTLGEVMWYGGYRTGFVGNWELGPQGTPGMPTLQGYDYAFGALDAETSAEYYPAVLWRNGERVEFAGNVDNGQTLGVSNLLTQDALAFLDRQDRNRPFYLHVHFALPAAAANEHRDLGIYADRDWPLEAKQFAAQISEMDSDVGRILERLHMLGIDDNTLVVFAGDAPTARSASQGAFFKQDLPLHGEPGTLSEMTLRAPLFFSWPGRIPQDAVSLTPCAAWDLMPTLADLTGTIKVPRVRDGISLVEAFHGAPMGDRLLYWERHDGGFAQAAQLGPWKATRAGVNAPLVLYNVTRDPGEATNIAADHPEIAQRLTQLMNQAHDEDPLWPAK